MKKKKVVLSEHESVVFLLRLYTCTCPSDSLNSVPISFRCLESSYFRYMMVMLLPFMYELSVHS